MVADDVPCSQLVCYRLALFSVFTEEDDLKQCVALRYPAIQILPPSGMMSLKDLKEHHYTKCPTRLSIKI
jgi:hypothetical protein